MQANSNVKEVKKVGANEFKRYESMAYEVSKARFPKGDEWSYIILFDKLIKYPNRVKKSEVAVVKGWPL